MKVWLIQGIISPYRIRLFEKIAKTEGVDFKLILLSKGLRCVPQWNFPLEEVPFKAERVPGWCFYTSYENQICINPRLLIKMLKEKPEVIICAGFSFATLLALIYKFITGRHYVIWNEGTHFTESRRSIFRKPMRRVMSRFASSFVTAGTLSQKYLESLLPQHPKKSFFTSYNCVDNEKFSKSCEQFKNEKEFSSGFWKRFPVRNILYAGQLIERKGIAQLLDVYREIVFNFQKPIGLIIVGQGPLQTYIENMKKENEWNYVFIEKYVPHNKMPRYYAIADVFMLLSLYDPNPLVVFESLACGIPIICSERAGNTVDFIVDGKNGYIVNTMNTADIVKKTISFLEDPKREEVAEFCKKNVQKANYNDSDKAFVNECHTALA